MEIVKDTPEFDPNKQYKWTPDTQFVLNGSEFATLLNTMRAHLSTEQAQITLLTQRASEALEAQLKAAVEKGAAVEADTQPSSMQVVQ